MAMTPAMVSFLAEYERRWRARQGTNNPLDQIPLARVTRGEMATWCKENQVPLDPLLDDREIVSALKILHQRLRREFPDERW